MPQQHNTAESGGVVYAVQHGNQYVFLYRNKPPYRVEPFPTVPEPLVRRAPSWLLSARHQVVPFYGRADELAWLRDWREGPTVGVSVRLVHAPGGQGKTRLAAQFAGACTRQGWTVAVARHRSEAAAAGGDDQQLAVYQRGLVLIVDYAERWPLEDLVTLLRQHQSAASTPPSTPLRVLLLARPGGGWWQSLAYQLSTIDIDDAKERELAPLGEYTPDRQAIYGAARDRFASVFAVAAPMATAEPDLGGPQFELVLAVHMKALVDVDAATRGLRPPSGRDQVGLSSYLLDREHEYWRAAHYAGTGVVRTSELGMSRTVYTAILTRALSHSDGVTALTRAKIGEATAQPVSQVLADHAVLYPPADPDTVLEPLYPDRLGEDFIALTTPGHTDTGRGQGAPWAATLPAQLLTTDDGDGPAPAYARAAITVLIEAAHRWPHLADRQLYPILRKRPRLALTAGGAALTRLAGLQHPGILDILQAIEAQLPDSRHVDLDTGIAALTTRLTTHHFTTTNDPAHHAQLYTILGHRLANAGQHDQALNASTNALEIYRRLAGIDPAAFEPDVALTLNNLSVHLSGLGRREEALDATTEALKIYCRLADINPAAFEANLARTLNSLGIGLSNLGRREEALDATTEALKIYRRLADINPAAFEPDLARTLYSLGVRLSNLGRREEALDATTEALKIYRRLADINPAAFDPNLARVLTNFGSWLSGLGRREEALDATTEALKIYRRLADINPAAFEPDLAGSLDNFGIWLSHLGRREEALDATTEAVQIYRRLADINPAAFEPDLAHGLRSFAGVRVAGQVEFSQALTAADESVAIYDRLVQRSPEAFISELRGALATLANVLNGLGRSDEATDVRHRIDQLGPPQKTAAVGPRPRKISLFRRWLRRS
jgi:tetratricopeptide (TPR) repeat protein